MGTVSPMADIYSDTIAAKGSSGELAVTPLAPLGFQASAPCQVYSKNTADGGARWSLIYDCKSDDDPRILYPPSGTIKVVAGDAETAVQISDG